MNVFDLSAKLTLDTSEYENGLKKAGGETENLATGTVSLGDKIKSGLGTAGKVAGGLFVAGISAAGAAVVGLARQSTELYAEYEQVAGGAQLLFGDAYDYVAEKAANAYSTVQMSQTEYLQQVNGFAVGLRESLGGNEQAAAELADKILTAEADIVAATGNTQENVQNAFNGIMKGNYTMLDNLQLGIKPTKEGMQEVIDKVNEWHDAQGEASNYTIDNLADVQSALVDYIEMQGLAGYAANEASSTIQGSLSQVKAAWQNLLTGFATEGADLSSLFDNFMDSAVTVFENVAPVVGRAVVAIVKGLVTHIPDILAALGEMLNIIFTELASALGELFGAAWEAVKASFEPIGDWFAEKKEQVAAAFESIDAWFSEKFTAAKDAVTAVWESIGQWFSDRWNDITTAFAVVTEWFSEKFTAAKDAVHTAWESIGSWFGERWADIQGAMQSADSWFSEKFTNAKNAVHTAWSGIGTFFTEKWTEIKNVFSNAWEIFKGIGGNIVQGLIAGIGEWIGNAIAKARELIQRVKGAANSEAGIASPSKEFKKIGKYLDEGLAEGIEDNAKGPIDKIKDLANQIIAIVEGMNKQVDSTLAKTVEDVAYIANMDYSAAMLKAENIEEFQGLAKLRDAKIAGEGIDLSAQGWKSNEDLLREWQDANEKAKGALAKTVEGVAYIADMDYAAAMLKAENLEEFQGLSKLRDAKIAGEDMSLSGVRSYDDLLKEWQESLDKQTAAIKNGGEVSEQPINITVKLDSKVVGEAAYKYGKLKARMVGA